MEWKKGNVNVARQLFETGARVDSHHLHIWQVWMTTVILDEVWRRGCLMWYRQLGAQMAGQQSLQSHICSFMSCT